MNPLLIALGVVVLAGALSSAIFAAMWRAVQGKLAIEHAAHESTKSNLLATQAAVEISETGRKNEGIRLEAIIALLKKEIAYLEEQKMEDPAAIRARLERLSGG